MQGDHSDGHSDGDHSDDRRGFLTIWTTSSSAGGEE